MVRSVRLHMAPEGLDQIAREIYHASGHVCPVKAGDFRDVETPTESVVSLRG